MKIFIGSSSEQKALVEWLTKYIRENFAGKLEPVPWTVPWTGGKFLLENLLTFVETTDASMLFWTADDKTRYRSVDRHEPRDNLVFEAGLFMAVHGLRRTKLLIPSYQKDDPRGQVVGPTDVLGLTYHSFPWDDSIATSGLPATAREVCGDLVALGPRPRKKSTIVDALNIQKDTLEELNTIVGDWFTVNTQAIQRLAAIQSSKEIDVLSAYRIGDIRRALSEFRQRPVARLRACFANMWDAPLLAAYKRKYYDREDKYIQDAVVDSIQQLLGPCKVTPLDPNVISVTELTEPPAANYEIYLTQQRITFGYYRIDDNSFVVPLDMKKKQDPSPPVWVLPRDLAPRAFEKYLGEYEQVLREALRVFPA